MKTIRNCKINRICYKLYSKYRKNVISLVTAAVLLFTSMPLSEASSVVAKMVSKLSNAITAMAEDAYTEITITDGVYTVNTTSDLVNLFNADPRVYETATILFAKTDGDFNASDFSGITKGLGSSDHPFKGSIETNKGSDINLPIDFALFDYLDDSAELCDITLKRPDDKQNTALLAEHVTHKTDNNEAKGWSVVKDVTQDDADSSSLNYPFTSVIGEMEAGSIVSLTISNTNAEVPMQVSNTTTSGNAGLACGTMGKGAQLTVNTTASGFSVTAASGNAGSLVGEMGSGAELIIDKAYSFTGKVTGKNAGGMVGSSTDGEVSISDGGSVSIEGTFATNSTETSGDKTGGVGGVYGEYNNNNDNSFDFDKYTLRANFDNSSIATDFRVGGAFGKINNYKGKIDINDITNSDDKKINVNLTSQNTLNVGGVIGAYYPRNIANTELFIHNIKTNLDIATYCNKIAILGGLIGNATNDNDYNYNAYINVKDVEVTLTQQKATRSGGLFGAVKSAFVDIGGSVKVNSSSVTHQKGIPSVSASGSLIGICETKNNNAGVVRLSGRTDISGYQVTEYPSKERTCNQLIGNRGDFLVYAVGWTLTRNSKITYDVDDMDWGEVLRLDGKNLTESMDDTQSKDTDVLYFDENAHTVTIKGFADKTNVVISNEADFARAALIMQQSSNIFVKYSTKVDRNAMLSATINIKENINLSGTGITGFMRDNGAGYAFSGTLNGDSKTITLAVGEAYGNNQSSSSNSNGQILKHTYNGLFARTKDAKINNLTVKGDLKVLGADGTNTGETDYDKICKIGGVVAQSEGTLSLKNVTSEITWSTSKNNTIYAGGIVGYVSNANAATNVSFDTCVAKPAFEYNGTDEGVCIGGVIGAVKYASAVRTIAFNDVKVNGSIKQTSTSVTNARVGGLIAEIRAEDAASGTYNNVAIKDVKINDLTIDTKATSTSGGFFGHNWYRTNVTLNSATVSNSTLTTACTEFGGLVTATTGYWQIEELSLDKNTISGTNAKYFGLLSDTTFGRRDDPYGTNTKNTCTSDGTYIEFNTADGYKVTNCTITLPNNLQRYDEIVAFSTKDEGAGSNGQSVVSIPAVNGDLRTVIMDGKSCNTYQNQTKKDVNTDWTPNISTRYYYNLDTIRSNTSKTDTNDLMLWSVYTYAADNIKQYFADGSNFSFDGAKNYDLNGYSYYPIDVTDAYVGGTFTFYNKEIETAEALTNGDTLIRNTTGSDGSHTQHYMMHHGLFRNVTNLTVSAKLDLKGSIGKTDNGSGALVCGKVSDGGNSKNKLSVTGSIVLDNIYVNTDMSGNGAYAPLLINKIGNMTDITISNVSESAEKSDYNMGGQTYAATSLIGDVGSATGANIALTFSNIKLSAHPGNSLFKNATLLESFQHNDSEGSTASYNYTWNEDWGTGNRNVTYGREVSDTNKNESKQNKYYGDWQRDRYTSPDSGTQSSQYSFTVYLPYVAKTSVTGTTDLTYDEIDVNIERPYLNEGCGTYSDPYIVDGSKLQEVARIINGAPSKNWEVNYNENVAASKATVNANDAFCSGEKHTKYIYDGSKFVSSSDSTKEVTSNDMIKYLCEAYYKINGDIVLGEKFIGLGGSTVDRTFRGVIVGDTVNPPTITNNSSKPLIAKSNGSVVKDVIIDNKANVELSKSNKDQFLYSTSNPEYYGGVIGVVFGGDNIIDNVKVKNASITLSGVYEYLIPVGGYIGAVIYGGVFFRNIRDVASSSSLSADKISAVSDNKYLYVNPYVGRVINGFAVEEGSEFRGSVNLKNGEKNYIITELNQNYEVAERLEAHADTSKSFIVPNSQALFVLSLISSCGVGFVSNADNIIGYGHYTFTRNGDYSKVGSKDINSSDSDYKSAVADYKRLEIGFKQDFKDSRLLTAYTRANTVGAKYYESKWVHYTDNFTVKLQAAEYDLTNTGFRGINGVYSAKDSAEAMKLTNYSQTVSLGNFTGLDSQTTIKNNMKLNVYKDDNYGLNHAFGFVNVIRANCTKGVTFSNINFTGSVSLNSFERNGNVDMTLDKETGGVVGFVDSSSATFNSVGLNDFEVSGTKNAGGLVGGSNAEVTVDGLKTSNLSVYAGGKVDSTYLGGIGGIVGYIQKKLTVTNSNLGINRIVAKYSQGYVADQKYGAGGLAGDCENDIEISNTTVKIAEDGFIGTSNNDNGNIVSDTNTNINAGGLIGVIFTKGSSQAFSISGCNVTGNMYGSNVGGLIGKICYSDNNAQQINISDSGYSSGTLNAAFAAGGLVGKTNDPLNVSSSKITSAEMHIKAPTNYNSDISIGGLAGYADVASNTAIDCSVSDTKFVVDEFNKPAYSANFGGLYGLINNSNGSLHGYNILLNNVTYKIKSNVSCKQQFGDYVGYLSNSANLSIKFVGVTRVGGTITSKDIGLCYPTNANSAFIHTDYNGSCTTDNKVTEFSQNANEASTVAANSPYVNVNPATEYAGLKLTGDFAAENMGAIIAAAKTGSESSNKYQNTGVNARADNIDQTKLKTFSEVADQKIDATNNMPILLIDDNSSANITKMLSDYVSVLTNHETDFNKDQSSLVNVSVQSYKYDTGKWTETDKSSLTYETSKRRFKTQNGVYDNDGTARFTLITLDYKDPTDSGNTALRIHIPVFVKKVLDFSFTSRVLTGTDYNHLDYTDKKFAFESFGSPITTYFTYTYYRTAQEWQDAINNGDDLIWNFDKKLELKGDGKASGFLPAETKLTLIDVNQSDKAYQTTANADVFDNSTGVLDLSKFGDDLITLNGLLMNYATVTAKEDIANGTLVVTEDKTKATAMAMLDNTLTYFRLATADDTGDRYTVEVKYSGDSLDDQGRIMLSENYYLTIQTPAADDTAAKSLIKNFVGYYSKVNSKLDCPENKSLPTYELNSDKSTYIIANFLTQEVTVQAKNSAEINTANDLINVTMTSTITLNKDLANTFRNYVLGIDFKMHQGFNISLTKFETGNNDTATQIVGGSTVEYNFTVGDDSTSAGQFNLTEAKDNLFLPYPKSIWDNLKDTGNNEVKITADVKITYSTSGMIEQFPERKDGDTKTGIAVNASSNIAYSEDSVEHSQVYKSVSTGSYYYRYAMSAADLSYDVVESAVIDVKDSRYSQLGVNPNDMSSEQMLITAKGHYDLSELTASVRENGDRIKFTMTLYQKNADDEYKQVDNIDNYLSGISMTDKNDALVTSKDDTKAYTFTVLGYEGDETYDVTTKFNVITGKAFEDRNQLYANYKVQLTAELLDEKDSTISGTTVSDYIIYTNARINTSFINAS